MVSERKGAEIKGGMGDGIGIEGEAGQRGERCRIRGYRMGTKMGWSSIEWRPK
mgnify:CR=1 FL=1